MKVYKSAEAAGLELAGSCKYIALGNFDGLHVGHQRLVSEVKQWARANEGKSGIFSFEPHPLRILRPGFSPKILLDIEDKILQLTSWQLDFAVFEPFSADFSALSPKQFVEEILVKRLSVSGLVVGYNFSFGRGGNGSATDLIRIAGEFGIETRVIESVDLLGDSVSSTRIRRLIKDGDVVQATKLLGRPYALKGRVTHGEKRGRTIGFPTANLTYPEGMVVPNKGVYIVDVLLGGHNLRGVANIGTKPTFHPDSEIYNIEIHILNFNRDIYNEHITVRFLDKIRNEKPFENVDSLVRQIIEDVEVAKKWHK